MAAGLPDIFSQHQIPRAYLLSLCERYFLSIYSSGRVHFARQFLPEGIYVRDHDVA
jgi:hypothetical protein